VAWDAQGYGLSPLPDPFSFDVVAEAGAGLIKALGSERNVFHGHSMGGQITPRIRLMVPDRVHGIVISSTIGYFANRTKEEQEEFVRKRTAPPPPGTDPVTAGLTAGSLALVLVTFIVVVMRYVFGLGSLYMQHSIIFLNAIVFLVAAGWALKDNEHVRVDVFYARASPRRQAMIDLAGVLIFLLPFCVLVWITAWPYVLASWRTLEGSLEVAGLPGVFLFKSFMLIYVALLALQGVSMAARALLTIAGAAPKSAPASPSAGVL